MFEFFGKLFGKFGAAPDGARAHIIARGDRLLKGGYAADVEKKVYEFRLRGWMRPGETFVEFDIEGPKENIEKLLKVLQVVPIWSRVDKLRSVLESKNAPATAIFASATFRPPSTSTSGRADAQQSQPQPQHGPHRIQQRQARRGDTGVVTQHAVMVVKMVKLPRQLQQVGGQGMRRIFLRAHSQALREYQQPLD